MAPIHICNITLGTYEVCTKGRVFYCAHFLCLFLHRKKNEVRMSYHSTLSFSWLNSWEKLWHRCGGFSLNVAVPPPARPKIQQTEMPVTCQRFDDFFLFGLVWQYSSVQTKHDKAGLELAQVPRVPGTRQNSVHHLWHPRILRFLILTGTRRVHYM